jgi:hypothetical protein
MMDILRDIIKSDAGSFGFIATILIAIFYAIYYITKFVTKINTEHGTFSGRIDKIEKNTDQIREDIIFIRATMRVTSDSFTKSQSPVSLTSKGEEMANELNIRERVALNWDRIFQCIEESVKDKNAYDIQQFCIERSMINLLDFFTEKDVREIKLIAFNEGRRVESFGGLIGVVIRDMYFDKKGIDIDEVDRNDPQKT